MVVYLVQQISGRLLVFQRVCKDSKEFILAPPLCGTRTVNILQKISI